VRRARRLVLCLALIGGTAAWAQAPAPPRDDGAYAARVSRVFDGDTLWVKPLAGGRYRKLRLDGIDAPEICQAGGETARDALAARVLDQVVQVNVRRYDDYGRGLARITHRDEDVGGWLVARGVAWSYRWGRSAGPYARQEEAARKAGLGVVADTAAELPRDFRRRHGPCPLH
jgi:endonuclease YncB( thermonuclease family)